MSDSLASSITHQQTQLNVTWGKKIACLPFQPSHCGPDLSERGRCPFLLWHSINCLQIVFYKPRIMFTAGILETEYGDIWFARPTHPCQWLVTFLSPLLNSPARRWKSLLVSEVKDLLHPFTFIWRNGLCGTKKTWANCCKLQNFNITEPFCLSMLSFPLLQTFPCEQLQKASTT